MRDIRLEDVRIHRETTTSNRGSVHTGPIRPINQGPIQISNREANRLIKRYQLGNLPSSDLQLSQNRQTDLGQLEGKLYLQRAVGYTYKSSLRARNNSPMTKACPYTPQPVPAEILGGCTLGSSGSRLLGSSRNSYHSAPYL
ncbi:hypothetical protein PIB30_056558 [Stylosanthes scabra]|uniref:Uncharacterized protein n=1 Tax=Stylosanthes scabra TaxID=79078 RepID=A0ABU6XHA5_9FABA|nr:hypothetical protein [Stylosanthes scabra]